MKVDTTKELEVDWDVLASILDYNRDSGSFIWKVSTARCIKVGTIAGSIDSTTGYLRIQLFGSRFQAHRLAWFYEFATWPIGILDHINRNKADNRINNLRIVSETINQYNSDIDKTNSTGFKGVSPYNNRFISSIGYKGKKIYLGIFDSAEEASIVYSKKQEELINAATVYS